MSECPICGCEDYESTDGFYFCAECGTQSQDLREEKEGDQDGTVSTSFYCRQIRMSSQGRRGKRHVAEDEGSNLTLYEFWQEILLKEFDTLVASKGYDTSVKEAGKLLWFRWLDVSFKKQLALYDKVEEIGTVMIRLHKNSKLQMARRKRGKTTQLAHSATLDSNMAGSSSRQELEVDREKFLQGRVHDKVLVALLYSAILFSGQLVTIEDLVKWMDNGELSLQTRSERVSSDMRKRLSKSQINTMCTSLPIPIRLYSSTVHPLWLMLSLPFPPVDMFQMGRGLLSKLMLPDSMSPCLRRLLQLYCPSLEDCVISRHTYLNVGPDVLLMGLIVILVKLIYRLDDHFELQQSALAEEVDPSQMDSETAVYAWEDLVALIVQQQQQHDHSSPQHVPYQDLCKLEDHSEYLGFCRTVVFERMKTRRAQTCDVSTEKISQGIASIMSQFLEKRQGSRPLRTESDRSSSRSDGNGSHNDPATPRKAQHARAAISSSSCVHLGRSSISTASSLKTIIPQLVPLDVSIPDLGHASTQYRCIPIQQHKQWMPLQETNIPFSQQFFLSVAARHVRVSPEQMAAVVYHLETMVLMPTVSMTNLVIATISRATAETTPVT